MGIADARAMHPSIDVVEAEPEADRRLLEALGRLVRPLHAAGGARPADGLYLDITGCAHLFGGEEPMLDDLLDRLFEQGFDARAGLASTPGAPGRRPLQGLPTHRFRGRRGGGAALAPPAARRLRLDAEDRAAWKVSACAQRARSFRRRGRRLSAVSAQTPDPARPGAWAGWRRRSRRACRCRLCRPSGLGRADRAQRRISRAWSACSPATLEDGSRAAGRRRAPSAACSVSRRRRGLPHRDRHLAAAARTGLIGGCSTRGLPCSASEIDAGFGFELVRLSALAVARVRRSSRRIWPARRTTTARRSRCLPTASRARLGRRGAHACRQRSPAICRSVRCGWRRSPKQGASCRGRRRFFVRHRASEGPAAPRQRRAASARYGCSAGPSRSTSPPRGAGGSAARRSAGGARLHRVAAGGRA